MTTFLKQQSTGQGVANVAIAANLAVKWHTTAGQIVVCGIGDIPIGVTMDAIAAGATGQFYRWGSGHEFYIACTGVSAGDYTKCGAAGVLVQEASAGTVTAATVGQAKTASDSANNIIVTATR